MAELGQTTDPKELIPGNPEAVHHAADTLVKQGQRLESIGEDLGRVKTPGWTGEASDAFWDKFPEEKPKWFRGSDAMSAAAKALNGHASTLSWAQGQAREAIDLWEKGEAATRQAVAEHNAAVERANAVMRANPEAGPITVPPFSDPGEKLRQQAQEILNRAREQLDEAGQRAAQAISNHGGNAPDAPRWLTNAAGVADAAIKDEGLGKTKISQDLAEWSKERRKDFGEKGEEGAPKWAVKLAEASGEANLWEKGVKGETHLLGAELEGSASVKTLGVEGHAGLSLTGDGLKAEIGGAAYLAKVAAEGSIKIGPGELSGEADAYVGAEANAEATVGPTGAHLGADAFAGAKAEGDVSADVGGIGAGVHGEAWAGAGVDAGVDLGMQDDGTFKIGGHLGIGLGVGAKLGGEITIDPGKIADTVGDAADAVGDAVKDVADAVGDVADKLNPF